MVDSKKFVWIECLLFMFSFIYCLFIHSTNIECLLCGRHGPVCTVCACVHGVVCKAVEYVLARKKHKMYTLALFLRIFYEKIYIQGCHHSLI